MRGAAVALFLIATLAFCTGDVKAQSATLSETMAWIANHLPARYFWVGSAGIIREDNSYQVEGCSIRITLTVLMGIRSTTLNDDAKTDTFVKIRPSSGYLIAYTDRDLKKAELPREFRSDYESGSRTTYVLDFRHVDPVHIDVERRIEKNTDFGIRIPMTADYLQIAFVAGNETLAPRLIAAVRHAVALCGGKADPF